MINQKMSELITDNYKTPFYCTICGNELFPKAGKKKCKHLQFILAEEENIVEYISKSKQKELEPMFGMINEGSELKNSVVSKLYKEFRRFDMFIFRIIHFSAGTSTIVVLKQ